MKKKVFIAGHNGMVGSAILRRLRLDKDVEIITKSRQELDLVSKPQVETFFDEHDIDQVYLAAGLVGGIVANNTYPKDFLYVNINIVSNIIEASHQNDVQDMLFLGSSCLYPRLANQPMIEDQLLTGHLEPTNEAYAIAIEGGKVIVKDIIADAFLQQILTRPSEYDVIATMNLNGDYISDALAAQVGGIGISPGGNINFITGRAIFEATHGTAPKYAGLDKVNPGSVILSGEMMFRYLEWHKAADIIVETMNRTISEKKVTYDFERLMEGATLLKCSEFGDALIQNM